MVDYSAMSDRELDVAVAEKVMGWSCNRYPLNPSIPFPAIYIDGYRPVLYRSYSDDGCIWSPSTDIAAAWKVVERMLNANPADSIARWRFDLRLIADQFFVSFNNRLGSDGSSAGHDPAKVARAICLAALAAVEAKEKTSD